MSVLLETTFGDIVIDLKVNECPIASKNFLKLCKIKYYNNCLFHNIQKDYLIQTGDPTNTGKGGESIYGLLFGEQAKYFEDEIKPTLKHNKSGTVSMANPLPNANGSQFFITVADHLHQLDEKHTIFGEVAEGFDTVLKINEVYATPEGKPLQVVRIKHTLILEDPFDDPPGLEKLIPDRSPVPPKEQWDTLLDEEEIERVGKPDERPPEEVQKELERKEAKSREAVLEMIGDIPDVELKPPDNILFVCKLNPVTTEEDLELIFSRFGEIRKTEVIRDWKTGDSLCYAFIEFISHKDAEAAYFKMDNVLIDDRRIHVDFSQSVSKSAMTKDGRVVRTFGYNYMRQGIHNRGANKTMKENASKPASNLALKQDKRAGDNYGFVFDDDDQQQESKRRKHDDGHKSKKDKDHDRERHRDSHRDRDREDRSKERDRERDRDRDSSRDRDRDRDRERNRDRR